MITNQAVNGLRVAKMINHILNKFSLDNYLISCNNVCNTLDIS